MKKYDRIIQRVIDEKIVKPQLLYKDSAGNTLWVKYIKTRGRTQIFAKNADGLLVNEAGVGMMIKESGIPLGTPISDKGRRIEKFIKKI